MGVKGLGGETAGMKSLELKHLELKSHVADLEITELLLDKGANLYLKDRNNRTPMYHAIEKGNIEKVKLLVKNGCPFDSEYQTLANRLNQHEIATQLPVLFEKAIKKLAVTSSDCVICYCPKNGVFAFLPCGHANSCEDCCKKLTSKNDKCPICRQIVNSYNKIYL